MLGYAERRRELHGPANSLYLPLLPLSVATIGKAYLLYALRPMNAEEAAREVLKTAELGDDYANISWRVTDWAGHDPSKARRAGYES